MRSFKSNENIHKEEGGFFRFPPFLLYVRCKSGVTFIRRSFCDDIQQRYCSVTGVAPPTLTRKEEGKLIEMFQEVERSYRKYINRFIFLAIHMY